MPAQLQRHALDRVGALAQQQTPDLGGAGEAEGPHLGALQQLPRQGRRIASDHLEHAWRNACFFGQAGQGEGGQWGFRGGFDDHRAARGQGCTGFAGDHGAGEIPGRHCGGHAHRLQAGAQLTAWQVAGQGLAVAAFGFGREPVEEVGAIANLATGLGQGLALFGRHQEGQVLAVLAGEGRPTAQQCATLGRQQRTPGREGCAGGIHGAVDPAHVAVRDFGDHFVGGRVGDGRAAFAVHPLAVYVGA